MLFGIAHRVVQQHNLATRAGVDQVAQDEFDSLPAEAQQAVREWALEIIAYVEANEPEAALAFVAEKCPEADDKMALWSQLPPPVRTTLKRISKEK